MGLVRVPELVLAQQVPALVLAFLELVLVQDQAVELTHLGLD